jgi:integrase
MNTNQLKTKTARLALDARGRPYGYASLAAGIGLGYRRNKRGAGMWVVRIADGKGGANLLPVGSADDFADADGELVFDFGQAQDRAKQIAIAGPEVAADDRLPVTVAKAIEQYASNLEQRGRNRGNADRLRYHLNRTKPALLAKPVALLTEADLKAWRDLLLTSLKTGNVLRTFKSLRAMLSHAATLDKRIKNHREWRYLIDHQILVDSYTPIDQVLTDTQVRTLINAAYAVDHAFGLFVEVLAVTGTRTSQATRLTIADLKADHLMMPVSFKGKNRKNRKARPVPIDEALAKKLRLAAGPRPRDAALLIDGNGKPWDAKATRLRDLFAKIARDTGMEGVTAYALRHSYITRSLKAGVPIRIVAAVADTSVAMIELTYSGSIADHSTDIARKGLLAV